MGKESSLWNTLKKNMKDMWVAERVENSVGAGTPDVYFTMKFNGICGWIELKHAHEWPKRTTTILKIPHYTPQQRSFIKRHGEEACNVWLLLQVGRDYLLFDWVSAQYVGRSTRDGLFNECERYWKNSIDYKELDEILAYI